MSQKILLGIDIEIGFYIVYGWQHIHCEGCFP